jgi:NAD(P)-dependent dehydrogenase (short-subunit alcohol dehydrogenase family)
VVAAFERSGACVVAVDRDEVDVSDPAAIQAAIEGAASRFGRLDILVNAAGLISRAPALEVTPEEWGRVLDVNLKGTFFACQAAARVMLPNGSGSIVNVASELALVATDRRAPYIASKAGVTGLTRALAVEWAPYGVCVNAILPGVFRTALNEGLLDGTDRGRELLMRTPMRRFGQPDELAGAAVFLASDAASFVTGHLLAVDGGFLASGVNQ